MSEPIKEIFCKYRTDKGVINKDIHVYNAHEFCYLYQQYFNHLRSSVANFLEIGIGDFAGSLFAWREIFPNANLYFIDYNQQFVDKFNNPEKKIFCYYGDQNNPETIKKVMDNIGNKMDIIVDDGSHIDHHIINSFKLLFPNYLQDTGIYVVEDTYMSYMNKDQTHSAITFLKSLVDNIHAGIVEAPHLTDPYGIKTIHFYREIIFVFKGNKISL